MAAARDSMETVSKTDAGVKLITITRREDAKRQALETAVKKTNQYGPFRELLLSIHKKDMKEQEDILEETIRAWRLDYLEDGYEQIDDISIIGLRV